MLTWVDIGTMAGAVAVVHAVLFLLRRISPHVSTTVSAVVAAEILMWAYGSTEGAWSVTNLLLWTSNGLIVATVSLGGMASVQSLLTRPQS